VTQRDYSKFIREDGRLYVRMIPRADYVAMVKEYQQRPEVIEAVFDELYWLWDLNERAKKAEEEGREVSRAELAAELIEEMDDSDWWKTTEAFEEHLITHFAEKSRTVG